MSDIAAKTKLQSPFNFEEIWNELLDNKDFVKVFLSDVLEDYILNFEGEPESTVRDRKVKQPPLKDVAGMFRSFYYAIYATVFNNNEKYVQFQETLFKASEVLYSYFTSVFSASYIDGILEANLNIGSHQERNFILKYCLLEKAVYELGYKLNSRPRWALIPLKGISNIIKH